MARYKGKDGAVSAAGNVVGEVESFDVTFTVNAIDANVMGSDWTDVCGGQKTCTGSMSVLRDPDDVGQVALPVGSEVALILYPEGNTTGNSTVTGTFLITEVGVSTSVGDLVKNSYSFQNQGEVTEPDVT